MIWKHIAPNPWLKLGILLIVVEMGIEIGAVAGGGSSAIATHQAPFPQGTSRNASAAVQYIPPPDRGTPPADQGTGSRGNCLYRDELPPFTALVGQPHLSQTLSERPTLWAYIPYTVNDVSQGDIIIQQESTDQEIYRSSFQLAPTPGIVGIQLPDTMPTLQVGETYRWYIDIQCLASSPTTASPATLTGIIERVTTPEGLTQNLQAAATPDERLATYGYYHIWYDLFTELARLRLTPQATQETESSLESLWQALLGDPMGANLADFIQAPVVTELTVETIPKTIPETIPSGN